MDKNTIIGFLLIGIVLIVFTWLNQPKADDELPACPILYGLPVYRTRLAFSPMQWLERRVPLFWKTS